MTFSQTGANAGAKPLVEIDEEDPVRALNMAEQLREAAK